jgi:Tfp pilus assembly protein PilN
VQLARLRRQCVRRWTAALVVSLAVMLFPCISDWWRRAEATSLEAEHGRLQGQLSSLRTEALTLARQVAAAQLQLERADALRAKRAWSRLLALVSDRTPPGCWYTTIATDPAVPPATTAPSAAGAAPRPGSPDTAPAPNTGGAAAARAPATVVIEAPRKLRLSGFAAAAQDPHELVANLKQSGAFVAVTLVEARLEPTPDRSVFRFEVVCEW